jgi:predicted ester cyclase
MNAVALVSRPSRAWRVVAAAALVTLVACSEPAPPPPPPAPPVATAEQRAQWYQACWDQFNNKQWDQFQNCYSENAVSEAVDSTPSSTNGRTAIIEHGKADAVTFPDRRGEVRLVLVNGDHIASVALFTATNTGEMPGPDGKPMKPTGKSIGFLMGHVIDVDAAGARAVREATYVDQGTMAAQLGLSPAPARVAEKSTGAVTKVVIAKNDATEKANLDATRASIDAFNRHDLKAIEAGTPDNYRLIEIAQPKDLDKKGSLGTLKELFGGFSDVTLTPQTMWAAGDYVVVEGTLTGTNTGDLKSMGVKKTGKKVTMRYFDIVRFENGKGVEEWLFYNGAAFASQLGLK